MKRSASFSLASFLFVIANGLAAAPYRPLVIAHRGASGYLPEHTLVAKAMAHAMKPDYIEQDVVLTKDDIPVVLHDHYLDTVTDVAAVYPDRAREDGRYYAVDFTLGEIRRLTVHERIKLASGEAAFPARFPVATRIPALKVPTLEEEIQLIQGLNKSTGREVGLYVELKSPWFHRAEKRDIARVVLDLLRRYGYHRRDDKVFIQSFEPRCLKEIRNRLRSPLKLVQLVGGPTWGHVPGIDYKDLLTAEGLRDISAYADGVGMGIPLLYEVVAGALRPNQVLPWAKRAGLAVHPYTLRADALAPPAQNMAQACKILFNDLKVDGVFADHPDQTVDFLRAAGLR